MPRKILLALWLVVLFAVTSQATNVDFLLTDSRLGIGQATNRTVYVQPMSVPSATASSVVIGTRLTFVTDSNGEFVFTNAMTGLYSCAVQGPPSRTDFTILVTATNLGTVYAADCLVASSYATFPSGSVAWSAAVTDNRYARSTTSLTNYATIPFVNTSLVNFSNGLGSAAFSNATLFYPANNPSNFISTALTNSFATTNQLALQGLAVTNFVTNRLAIQGTLWTNAIAAEGTSATNYSLSIGLNATNFTKLVGLSLTNYVLATSNALQNAFGASGNYQPTSANLTNWSLHATNDYTSTNVFQTFTNLLGTMAFRVATDYQPTSLVLSNLVTFGTNFFYPRANPSNFVTATVTNGLATTNYVISSTNGLFNITQPSNSVLTSLASFGTNFWYPRSNPSNFISTADLSGYTLANNGYSTNQYLTNATLEKAWLMKGFYAIPSTATSDVQNNNYPRQGNDGLNVYWLPPANGIFMGVDSGCTNSPMISFYTLPATIGQCTATNAVLSAEMALMPDSVNFNYIYGQYKANTTNRAYEWRKMAPSDFITINSIALLSTVTAATNTLASNLTNYYPVTNPSNFVSQTIWATNNPSNIVVTAASMAYWTNGAEWRCVSGSNWFPTILP